jgi:nitrate reductase NapE component
MRAEDAIMFLLVLQVMGMCMVGVVASDNDLPWQRWRKISPESVLFLNVLAFVFAAPILVTVLIGAFGYSAWSLAKGPVYLARDAWCALRKRQQNNAPVKSNDQPDTFEREAAVEVERLLTEGTGRP